MNDPDNDLRLGEPATIRLSLKSEGRSAAQRRGTRDTPEKTTGDEARHSSLRESDHDRRRRQRRWFCRLANCAKTFRRDTGEIVQALDGISVTVAEGTLTALVGPDGAGKTTLMRLAAGLMTADGGELTVLGVDAATDPAQIQARIGYMPQRFGLYEDLTVQENLNLYADLHGVTAAERRERYPRLMEMTALGPFTDRLAGRLSGGMKQKLGLACTLVRSPELLLLDEPTVGVDPLSRRELWTIILQLVHEQNLTVLVSTSYLDEADRCEHAIVLHQGKVLAEGPPAEVTAAADGANFLGRAAAGPNRLAICKPDCLASAGHRRCRARGRERVQVRACRRGRRSKSLARLKHCPRLWQGDDGSTGQAAVRRWLHGTCCGERSAEQVAGTMSFDRPPRGSRRSAVIEVHDLVRHVRHFHGRRSRELRRSIAARSSGCSGPTARGRRRRFACCAACCPPRAERCAWPGSMYVRPALRPGSGSAMSPKSIRSMDSSRCARISNSSPAPMACAASGGASGSNGRSSNSSSARSRGLPSGQLPGGYKQRLAMAAALLHEPEILFLDEPTSGADPLARREFWQRITSLAAQGVTVIVTTHFMEEAEYCDRVAIMDAGGFWRKALRPRSAAEPTRTGRRASAQGKRLASRTWKMHSSRSWRIRDDAESRDAEAKRRAAEPEARDMTRITIQRRIAGRPPSCGASRRWFARKRGRSSAIRAASRSASCCRWC